MPCRHVLRETAVYSPAAQRLQGLTALRADDPAAAVHGLSGALAALTANAAGDAQNARHDLSLTLARAKISPLIRPASWAKIEALQMPPQARKRRTFVDLR